MFCGPMIRSHNFFCIVISYLTHEFFRNVFLKLLSLESFVSSSKFYLLLSKSY